MAETVKCRYTVSGICANLGGRCFCQEYATEQDRVEEERDRTNDEDHANENAGR